MIAITVQEEADDDSDLSDYGDEVDGRKDALAEPCFMLIGEIFELRGSEYCTFLICSQLHFFFFKYNLKIKKVQHKSSRVIPSLSVCLFETML